MVWVVEEISPNGFVHILAADRTKAKAMAILANGDKWSDRTYRVRKYGAVVK